MMIQVRDIKYDMGFHFHPTDIQIIGNWDVNYNNKANKHTFMLKTYPT